jgi:hypothetical protein
MIATSTRSASDEQDLADAGIDGALGGGEGVVEVEGDQAHGGHRVLPSGE